MPKAIQQTFFKSTEVRNVIAFLFQLLYTWRKVDNVNAEGKKNREDFHLLFLNKFSQEVGKVEQCEASSLTSGTSSCKVLKRKSSQSCFLEGVTEIISDICTT